MKHTLQAIAIFAVIILVADVCMFGLWVLSGQKPVDNFYLGTITGHAVQWVAAR